MMEEIREKLKAYMAEKDYTVSEVAAMVGRSPMAIWKFLRGKTKPRFQTIYRIARLIEGDKR